MTDKISHRDHKDHGGNLNNLERHIEIILGKATSKNLIKISACAPKGYVLCIFACGRNGCEKKICEFA